MNDTPTIKKVFRFRLAPWLPGRYATYLHWLSHLLERLGRDGALATWEEAFRDYDERLTLEILGAGWSQTVQDEAPDVEEAVAAQFARRFPDAIQGVSPARAREMVEGAPPIRQMRRAFPYLNVWKELTAYEVLHLGFDGLSLLAETLIRNYGKQGELIAYDLQLETRLQAAGGRTGSVAEFIADFTSEPAEANIFSAGLVFETVRTSENEAVVHVTECAWAKYFRQRHPQVGYLMACSTDEAAYRAFNPRLRLQRTSTLMEGGGLCDFRVYAVGEQTADSQ